MGKFVHEYFLLRWFVEILIVKNFFYSWRFFNVFFFEIFEILFFEIFPLWRFIQCSSRGLKNCFSLLVLRLKIFVLVIWLRVIGLGLDFKMDANSRLKLGILINSGCEVWNDFLTLVVYLGWLFAQLSWFCCFLMCLWNFEFGDCFVIMGIIGFVWLKWVCPNWIGFVEILQLLRPVILFFFFFF